MRLDNAIETAKRVLSEMNCSKYVQTAPRPNHANFEPQWYVTILDGTFERFAPAATVWEDGMGRIWLESAHLGSTMGWVEEEYGEKASNESMDIDYRNLTLAQVQNQLNKFPRVSERIERSRRTAEDVSRKSGIRIEFLCDGRSDVGWFLFRARVSPKGESRLETELRKAVGAMREVYDQTEGAHYERLLSSVDDVEARKG